MYEFTPFKKTEKLLFESFIQFPKELLNREDFWRKYHKTTNENDKITIKKEINNLTEKIDTITAQKNACNRIIDRYSIIKEALENQIEYKERRQNLAVKGKIIRNK